MRDGGCTSGTAKDKEGDAVERLARLAQLAGIAAEYEPGALSGAAALDSAFDADGNETGGSEGAAGAGARAPPSYTPLQCAQNFLDEAALYSGGWLAGWLKGWAEGV